ncbi:MAG: hypothetical protein R3247_14430 [Rhodothermales bacterium]|nr:hypothetical protein [Rhodothermales bacterium]
MSQICVSVPPLQVQQTIDLEVTINGKKRVMNYRVETFAWPEALPPSERIDRLRDWIEGYDAGWELVQIGRAGSGLVPVTFRRVAAAPETAAPS